MLAAILANLTQSGVSRLSRHREWQDPQDPQAHPRYTDLSSGKWKRPSSLPSLFGNAPVESIGPGKEAPDVEVLESSGVVDIPAFLDLQEWKTLEVAREEDSLGLLEDEELIELLLMIGEI